MKRYALGLVLFVSAWLMTPLGHAQESLERGLLRQAPVLIKYFQNPERNYKNVGVLKFLVSREGKPFTDNVGTLNLLAARRLELALVLANDPRTPVGIIENASSIARTITGSSHLSKDGRDRLFTGKYRLAWGKETVEADAFVTGTIEISKDLRKLTVSLYCFDRANNKLIPVGDDFQVKNAPDRLTEMGESFVMRDLFSGADPVEPKKPGVQPQQPSPAVVAKQQEKVFHEAVKVREQETKHPAQQSDQPVALEVLYDGVKVPLEFRDGKAFIAEPREGQNVEFILRRDGSRETYAIVLKVNGENTLDRQRLPDFSCRKWVLSTGDPPAAIRGYQMGDHVLDRFRVASVAESTQREVNYGNEVGTITMTVFREQSAKQKPRLVDEVSQQETAVAKLTEFSEPSKNYNALKAQLLEDANRGLIVQGDSEASNVQIVAFVADPTPVMSVTIVYYNKQGGGQP